jgi:FkbM family methyltransferase
MNFRKTAKRFLYGRCPGFAGAFRYFGIKVHFPKNSFLFYMACDQGIFEAENLAILLARTRPGTWFLDAGTNIGLMSVPVLVKVPDCHVVSFEPSPSVRPFLERTIAGSGRADRWILVPKAVGAAPGSTGFSVSSPENSAFDGVRATGRMPTVREVEVEVTTIDIEWKRLGCPAVSVIKCDIEGGELDALRGAQECLSRNRPDVLFEWNAINLKAYHCPPTSLLEFVRSLDYRLYALPSFTLVSSNRELEVHMSRTESFLLLAPG